MPSHKASRLAPWFIVASFFTGIAAMLALLVATPTVAPFIVLGMLALGNLPWIWVRRTSTWLTVGQDGVLITRPRTRRFVPFVDIAEVRQVQGGVLRLVLHSGELIEVFTGKDEALGLQQHYLHRLEVLVGRLRAEVEAERAGAVLSPDDAADRALRARAHAMLHDGTPGAQSPYRVVPAPNEDDLWCVAESKRAPAAERAAAAALLLQQDDLKRIGERLRIATEGCVEPHLDRFMRIATEQADDETLLAALTELEEAYDQISAASPPTFGLETADR